MSYLYTYESSCHCIWHVNIVYKEMLRLVTPKQHILIPASGKLPVHAMSTFGTQILTIINAQNLTYHATLCQDSNFLPCNRYEDLNGNLAKS